MSLRTLQANLCSRLAKSPVKLSYASSVTFSTSIVEPAIPGLGLPKTFEGGVKKGRIRNQAEEFQKYEGDNWYARNREELFKLKGDVVTSTISHLHLRPKKILEIGSANGWRLNLLAQSTGAQCFGIEPSKQAVSEGTTKFPELRLQIGTADNLPFDDNSFDLVILGFCFYLLDPEQHLQSVAEADRCLADRGFLAILDFQSAIPFYNEYHHATGIRAFKMDFSRYFLAHPAYSLVHRQLAQNDANFLDYDHRQGVDILTKDTTRAFSPNPFSSNRIT